MLREGLLAGQDRVVEVDGSTVEAAWVRVADVVGWAEDARNLAQRRTQRARSPEVSRLYLQCAPDEDLAGWPDGRIWDELETRLSSVRKEMAPPPSERPNVHGLGSEL